MSPSVPLPSAARDELRGIHKFIFDDLQWGYEIRSTAPLQVAVHGSPEFERLRCGGPFSDPLDALCEVLILAIVAHAERASALSLGLTSTSMDNDHALREARRRLRNYARDATYRAMEESGVEGWRGLRTKGRATSEFILNRGDSADLLELLKTLVAPPDDLKKAIKYVMSSPLKLEIERNDEGYRVTSSAKRDAPYLAGSMTSTAAEKARSAVAVAARCLVGAITPETFDRIVPASLRATEMELGALRVVLVNSMAHAIETAGHQGLVDRCTAGLG